VTVDIPKSDPHRKTGKFLSLPEASKAIGINTKTYLKNEGTLFPKVKRLHNHYRIFTNEDVKALRRDLEQRTVIPFPLCMLMAFVIINCPDQP
jgi:hypothetical protein